MKATPKQWDEAGSFAADTRACLLELRTRIEALEVGATCPHVVTSDEGTSYCNLAEQVAVMESSAPPASSLVEKVALKIAHKGCFLPTEVYGDDARAAIREVATWLKGKNVGAGRAAARWLREEVDR